MKVAEAVNYLHTLDPSVIHGDLKPSNVLMSQGEPLLCDFGMARVLQDVASGYTTATVVPGTRGFQAPGVLTGGAATTASDVYAFGCVILSVSESIGNKQERVTYLEDRFSVARPHSTRPITRKRLCSW